MKELVVEHLIQLRFPKKALEGLQDNLQKIDDYHNKILEPMIEDDQVGEDVQEIEFFLPEEEYRESYRTPKTKVENYFEKKSSVIEHSHTVFSVPSSNANSLIGNLLTCVKQHKDSGLNSRIYTKTPLLEKFQYLVQSITKESKAYGVVSSYPQADDNYIEVIEALKKKFGKEEILDEVYVRELLKLVINNNQNPKTKGLSVMFDTLESHLRSLEFLGVTREKYVAMPGAQRSYVKEDLALSVGAVFVERECLARVAFGGSITPVRPINKHKFTLQSLNGATSQEIEALDQKKICEYIPKLHGDLWRLEVVGITDPIEVQSRKERERICYEQFLKTVKRDAEGQCEMSLPWKYDGNSLPDNFKIAEKRLSKLRQRLKLSNQFKVYHNMFVESERENLIERVRDGDNGRHYLPHVPVFKIESETTPFQEKWFGLVVDIRRAFLMIKVNLEDCEFLRFLWLIAYHLDNAAPSSQKYAQVLKNIFCVDNCILFVDSVEKIDGFEVVATELLANAKMELRMWENIVVSHNENFPIGSSHVVKLGLKWNKVTDTLSCNIPEVKTDKLPKRQIMFIQNRVYDPIGILVAMCLTFHELLASLEASDPEDNTKVTINIMPPINANEDLTDEDTGNEDYVSINNLPGNQLLAVVEINNVSSDNKEDNNPFKSSTAS
ncbi:hypothetical protein ILUMI_01755 [Ignelater luminosus]|uniref:Uncharacterized protein n=1 Tax=Ignelater luminosus TaxID=2038154 RepID=A0A8K0DDZ2_IGNLU|nr:hypothetical protein ILUMI_01755 [Ignelater luminosus]